MREETRIDIDKQDSRQIYSLINKVKSPYLPARQRIYSLGSAHEIARFLRYGRAPHETVQPAARYSNPENFRHRPRRILRMSLINPTLPFFSFTHRHSINKRCRWTRWRRYLNRCGGCAPLSLRVYAVLHFYPRPLPRPSRTFAEKALQQ